MRLPRILLAAPASGGGKTTLATGLMGALRAAGHRVASFKVGPDYIDPGYHTLAAGRPGRNLDAVMCGADLMAPLLAHGSLVPEPADVAVIEGVMGLFDGRLGDGEGSSAQIAALTGTPVVLVIDTAHASLTHAAVAAGLASFDPQVRVAGVILNRVASPRHEAEVRRGLERVGLPVLGAVPRDAAIAVPSRHLGLVPAAEREQSAVQVTQLAGLVGEHVDLSAVLDVARSAPDLDVDPWDPVAALAGVGFVRRSGTRPLVAMAGGRAFTFRYPETAELLEAAGIDVVDVDPLVDARLPEGVAGLYLGGGFPEMHAAELSDNESLRADIRDRVAAGLPVVAECAGLLYLCRELDGVPMTGVLPLDAAMGPRLTMGYRQAEAPADTPVVRSGERVVGHEFHRTTVAPVDDAAALTVRSAAWRFDGEPAREDGAVAGNVHASYLHLHWAGTPAVAAGFARLVERFAEGRQGRDEPDLLHHGDHDVQPGLVDLAVNVRVPATPTWLVNDIVAGQSWASYPDAGPARHALAAMHGVDARQVLPTAGGAEAFTLVARALRPHHAVIVHPQFTEPEVALRAAGHDVDRLVLGPDDGFSLDPRTMPADADLVVVGNPTNPTGRLHPRALLEQLRRPGRVLVVDEAFMDATDEAESLVGGPMDDLLVLRSLTKTYGLAGVRAGYVVGDRALVGRLEAQQPPWSVSTPAATAMVSITGDLGRAHRLDLARALPGQRADLVSRLEAHGLGVVESGAPFVLVDTSSLGPRSIRPALARRGFAVRRGETFPGLGPTWIRVAVRDARTHTLFAEALGDLIAHPDSIQETP